MLQYIKRLSVLLLPQQGRPRHHRYNVILFYFFLVKTLKIFVPCNNADS